MTKDPICGMELEEDKDGFRIDFKGKKYFFCSESCLDLFKKLNNLGSSFGEAEMERKMIAYNTLKQLSATIAHYIRNSNAVISAQLELCERAKSDVDSEQCLSIIKRESDKIERVVSALVSISDIRLKKYLETEEQAIIDLKNEIETKME